MIILYIFCFLILVSLRFINVSKKCTECSSKDIQFLRTEVDSGYKHKTKSGKPDKRYTNNYYSSTSYIFHCNKCKEDFQDLSVTQRDRTQNTQSLLDNLITKFYVKPKRNGLELLLFQNKKETIDILVNKNGTVDKIPEWRMEHLNITSRDLKRYSEYK